MEDSISCHKKSGMSTIMIIETLSKKIKNNTHKNSEKTIKHKENIPCNKNSMYSKDNHPFSKKHNKLSNNPTKKILS